jgi:hypothetical protein
VSSSTSNFKYFARAWLAPYVVLLAFLLILLDTIFDRWVVTANPSAGAAKVRRLLSGRERGEVAILGSSRALGAFRPSLIGPQVFNYALEGIRSDVIEALGRASARSADNAPVVIGLDYEMFEPGTTYLGSIDNYLPSVSDARVRALLQRTGHYRWYHAVVGLRYFGTYEYYAKAWVQTRFSPTKVYDRGGACDHNALPPGRLAEHVRTRLAARDVIQLDRERARHFRKLLTDAAGRRFILVTPPYHPAAERTRRLSPEARAFFDDLQRLPNVHWVEVAYHDYPDELFSDTSHVNCAGAARFSREFATHFRALGFAP